MHFFRKGQEKAGGLVTELRIMVSEGKKNIDVFNLGKITSGECTTACRGMEVSPQSSLGVMEDGRVQLQQGRSWLDIPDLSYSWGKHSGRG